MRSAETRHTTLVLTLMTMLLVTIAGCKDEEDMGGSGDSDGLPDCPACDSNEEVYACIINNEEVLQCHEDLEAAQASCGAILGNGVQGNGPVTCDSQNADTDSGWTPGSYVFYNSSTQEFEIDEEFFNNLLANPNQLLYDNARLEWQGAYFEFDDIITSDLAYILGFRNGDRLVSVNGQSVSSISAAWSAFGAVYGATSFTVYVLRSGTTVVLEYSLR